MSECRYADHCLGLGGNLVLLAVILLCILIAIIAYYAIIAMNEEGKRLASLPDHKRRKDKEKVAAYAPPLSQARVTQLNRLAQKQPAIRRCKNVGGGQ